MSISRTIFLVYPETEFLDQIKDGTEFNFLIAIHVGINQWDFMERGSKLCALQLFSKSTMTFSRREIVGDHTFNCLRPTEGSYVTFQYLGYHTIRHSMEEIKIIGKRKHALYNCLDFCLNTLVHSTIWNSPSIH